MYGKLKEGKLIIAESTYITDDGYTICNFNQSEETMKKYGFKPIIEAEKPDYPYIISYEETENEILEIIRKDEEEAARIISHKSLTRREVFLALFRKKGITPEQIRNQITDQEALIEFDYAERYYRGNPLIDTLGQALGFSKEDLDYLFIHGEFSKN